MDITMILNYFFLCFKYIFFPFTCILSKHLTQSTCNSESTERSGDLKGKEVDCTGKLREVEVDSKSRKVSGNDVKMSKMLVSILRHKAKKLNIYMDANGFVKLKDLLKRKEFRHLTVGGVKRMVDNNDKKRFFMKEEDGELMIRANQGHSIKVENLALKPILCGEDYPNVIHGTYYKSWESIRKEGLRKMNRMHIHFARGEPGETGVISGMRSSCQVMIHLNLNLALKEGLTFYESENNVILTEGDEHGFIKPKYFEKVIDRKTRQDILNT